MSAQPGDLDRLCIDTIRTLAMDAVQKANSGHPGTPMALAPVAYELWQNHLRFDPADPIWPNRDRFVLSVGHASMLLYGLLHLTRTRAVDSDYNQTGSVSVSLEDIQNFRQLDSKCPGHPEYHLTSGVETTTGPLGQGVATSVGMAMAERWLAAHYNRPGFDLFDYKVYALAGDGDLMEGVSAEAASLAGHLRLANLCWIYDSNHITIEGGTSLAFSEDVGTRFAGYGWHVEHVEDANDRAALGRALAGFQSRTDKPTMIIVRSVIGFGAPKKAGTAAAHGEPLGAEEIKGAKKAYGWPEDAQFLVPDGVYDHFANGIGARGGEANAAWQELFARYARQFPDEARQIDQMQRRELPEGWDRDIPSFPADAKGIASRDSSSQVLNALAKNLPWLVGGAADLAPSTKTLLKFEGAGSLQADEPGGRNLHFGIREHAMGSACNGLALSKLRAYGSTFLIFSDYMKPAIRLSALMELPVVWIFTHDSIGVGEDGPTHQPVEQLLSLRSIPGLITLRPADANEVAEAWRVIAKLRHQPACLVLSRQALPTFDRERYHSAEGTARGAYIMADPEDGKPEVILIGTGSEVQICIEAHEKLRAEGVRSRVVSMPSWELFEQQDRAYQDEVLPASIEARVSVEQASVIGWDRYAGRKGAKIGMQEFGASAPLKALLSHFGFTADKVAVAAKEQIARVAKGG
ncbi:MAG TPA: transketolase [Geminicoccus sp.]|uniref:transketolase n=1 Tax=Geminicoccus sp. TaxID=2024832 RepID=UPI002C0874B8|nr:transketolase [Geminicoccus sp.]HWL71829.1 transketolase [Geminicoccus sp.]